MLVDKTVRKRKGKRFDYHEIWDKNNPDNLWCPGKVIHHIDNNPTNNDLSNLKLMMNEDHIKLHHKGKLISEHQKKIVSAKLTGIKRSEKTKEKISKFQKGNKNWLGKKHSEETKEKMSKDKIEKYKAGQIKSFCTGKFGKDHPGFGHIVTDKHRDAVSKAQKGKILSEETKQKLREFNLGKRHSEETKEKMRQTHLKRRNLNA